MIPNLKLLWQNRIEILKGVGNSLVKTRVIEQIAAERLAICNECPSKNNGCKLKDCCGECGCHLAYKTRSIKSSCPLNKWEAINLEDDSK